MKFRLTDCGRHVSTNRLKLLKSHFLGFIDNALERRAAKYIDNLAGHAVRRFE